MNSPTPATMSDSIIYDKYERFINSTYPPFLRNIGLDYAAVRAEQATITDSSGREYIDCSGGYGICGIGHNHPELIAAMTGQLQGNHTTNRPFISEISVRLAESLAGMVPIDDAFTFFCNSGSEAVDSAIKLARLRRGKKKILSAQNSFHGYTLGALSVSGIPSFKRLFEPLLPEISHIPYNDIASLREAMTAEVAALILEPMQHEAGVVVPDSAYFQEVRCICDEAGALLIMDEIKTGCGRTGRMFASEHYGISPDMILLGKSLGGGIMPIGALVARRSCFKKFSLSFSMSASSYAGNSMACQAAYTTLQILQRDGLIQDVARKGDMIIERMGALVNRFNNILQSVTGRGLLIGLETRDAKVAHQMVREMTREGVIVLPAFARPSVLMIEPPFVISDAQIVHLLKSIENVCSRVA